MIYASCIHVFCLLNTFESHKSTTIIILSLYSIIITSIYLVIINPVFHQLAYAFLVLISVIIPIYQLYTLRKSVYKNSLVKLMVYSLGSYLLAFALWNVDNHMCRELREVRDSVGYPGRIVLEFHAYWHLGTAYGAYGSFVLAMFVRAIVRGKKPVLRYLFVFPCIVVDDEKLE